MKKLILLGLLMSSTGLLMSQHWQLQGNPEFGVDGLQGNENNHFGSTYPRKVHFISDSEIGMTLDTTGWVGINEVDPEARFHVNDGAVLFSGNNGNNPNLGAGTRFIWIPKQGSLCVGKVSGTLWDDPNVGTLSTTFGEDNQILGTKAFAVGELNEITNLLNVAIGQSNEVNDTLNFAIGQDNVIETNTSPEQCGNIALGRANTMSGHWNVALGETNTLYDYSFTGSNIAMGLLNKARGHGSISAGYSNDVKPVFDSEEPEKFNSFAFGAENIIEATRGLAIGNSNKITAKFGYTFGSNLLASNEQSFVLGQGIDNISALENSIPSSLIIGFNSDSATVFISEANGTSGSFGNVGIATTTPMGRLHIKQLVGNESVSHTNSIIEMEGAQGLSTTNTGLKVQLFKDPATSVAGHNYGVHSEVEAGRNNRAIYADAKCTSQTSAAYGLHSSAGGSASSSSNNTGVYGYAHQGNNCKGVHGYAYNGSNSNFGVYGQAYGNNSYAGYFVGNVYRTGTDNFTSDENLKKNIVELELGLDEILQLETKSYEFKCTEFPELALDEGHHCGLIAQQVEQVLPDLVKSINHISFNEQGEQIGDPMQIKSIAYMELLPVLIKAVQEQNAIIEELSDQIESQENMESRVAVLESNYLSLYEAMEECCSLQGTGELLSGQGQNDIEILPHESGELMQNHPNPFMNSTTIRYKLASSSYARICIFDANGRLLDTLHDDYMDAGEHQLLWNGSNLSPGIYFYSLSVDNIEQVRRAIKVE